MTGTNDLVPTAAERGGGQRPIGSANRRVAASTVSLVASNALVALLGVVVLRATTHSLGTNGYGTLAIALNFLSISFLFADLGVNTFSGREIARDTAKASEIIGQNLGLRLVLAGAMVPVVVGIGVLIYPASRAHLDEGIFIVSLTLPFEAVRAVSLSYYVATIQNYKSAVVALLSSSFYVGGVLLALALGFGLVGCFVAYLISMILTGLVALVSVRSAIHFRPRFAWRSWSGILRQSLGIGSIQIVNVLYIRTNVLLLSLLTTPRTVAIYWVGASMATFFLVIPNSFMTSVMPLVVRAGSERLTELIETSVTYMAMTGMLVVAGASSLSAPVIRELTPGHSFAGSSDVLAIICFSVMFTCITSVFAYSSFARNQHHRLFFISLSGLVANVVLDLILIPILGGRGAAIATDIVEALILLGTYGVFRSRVGSHFHAWLRLGRIVVIGLTVAAIGRFWASDYISHGIPEIVLGLVAFPVVLLAAFFVFRCFPARLRLSSPTEPTQGRRDANEP